MFSPEDSQLLCSDIQYVCYNKHIHKFIATVSEKDNGNVISQSFECTRDGFNNAVSASSTYRDKKRKRKQEYLNMTNTERKLFNTNAVGDNCKIERDFVNSITTNNFCGYSIKCLNDSTLCDMVIGKHNENVTGVQVKVTRSNVKGISMKFNHIRGYSGILCILWNKTEERGIIADGTALDDLKQEAVSFTFTNACTKPFYICEVNVSNIVHELIQHSKKYKEYPIEYHMWNFKSHTNILEMIGNYYLMKIYGYIFPSMQGSHVDMELHVNDKIVRSQCKFARKSRGSGFSFNLHPHAGSENSIKKYAPYPEHAFDELVVFLLQNGMLHVWKIPSHAILFAFKSDTCPGVTSGSVYFPSSDNRETTWRITATYYIGNILLYDLIPTEMLNRIHYRSANYIRELFT